MQKTAVLKRLLGAFLTSTILTILFACSNSVPLIDGIKATRIVYFDTITQKADEYFSVFCAVQDKDGIQDINSIYIIDDSKALLWHLTAQDIIRQPSGGRTWYGNSRIAVPHGEPVPTGLLRIVVYDRAGNKAETEAGLPSIDHDPITDIPRVKRNSTGMSILPAPRSDIMERQVAAREWSQTEISRVKALDSDVPFHSVISSRNPTDVKFFVYDSYYGGTFLIISGPW